MKWADMEAVKKGGEHAGLRERLMAAAGSGKFYKEIAAELNDQAVAHPGGATWNESEVSQLLIFLGVRRRQNAPKPATVVVEAPAPAITKWDVLKLVEKCTDFSLATRKALIGMIIEEFVK